MPLEVALHYPVHSEQAGPFGTYYDPCPTSHLVHGRLGHPKYGSELRGHEHVLGGSHAVSSHAFDGTDGATAIGLAAAIVDTGDRSFLEGLYSRYRCRVCSERCNSKPALAAHVATHRSATASTSESIAGGTAGLDAMRLAHFTSEAERLKALTGCGPVVACQLVDESSAAAPSASYCRMWYPNGPW
jgi:hypothetical protein